jgi:Spy/CpxP family protein refolding chaperone
MNPQLKSRLVATVVIVLVFLAGMALGASLHRALLGRGRPGFGLAGPPPHRGPPPEMKSWMLARLDHRLNLTPEQHARIDTVLTQREAEIRALMSATRPRFDSIAARTRSEIQAVLTPEQQQKFAEITKQMDARREHGGHP